MSETVLTRQDHGKSIEASVGSVLTLQLDESPTTGYAWVDRSSGAALKLERSDFVAASGAAVGGGGQRSFRFSVCAPGAATLRVTLQRAWEADAPPADEFSVSVQARLP
jgi:inhibitor of cysteine peptidase